jgi:hypothetical protein
MCPRSTPLALVGVEHPRDVGGLQRVDGGVRDRSRELAQRPSAHKVVQLGDVELGVDGADVHGGVWRLLLLGVVLASPSQDESSLWTFACFKRTEVQNLAAASFAVVSTILQLGGPPGYAMPAR